MAVAEVCEPLGTPIHTIAHTLTFAVPTWNKLGSCRRVYKTVNVLATPRTDGHPSFHRRAVVESQCRLSKCNGSINGYTFKEAACKKSLLSFFLSISDDRIRSPRLPVVVGDCFLMPNTRSLPGVIRKLVNTDEVSYTLTSSRVSRMWLSKFFTVCVCGNWPVAVIPQPPDTEPVHRCLTHNIRAFSFSSTSISAFFTVFTYHLSLRFLWFFFFLYETCLYSEVHRQGRISPHWYTSSCFLAHISPQHS